MNKSSLLNYANKVKSGTDLKPRRIVARVAGTTFDGRQDKLRLLDNSTSIKLERDRRNQYDFYAVKVLAMINGSWEHVGFLPATMSKRIAKSLDTGNFLTCGVHKVKGGMESSSGEILNFGLEVYIEGQML